VAKPELAEALHLLVSELDQEAEYLLTTRHSITHSQLAFMAPLLREGPLDISTLATRMNVTVAAVSKRASWFVDRGYVRIDSASAPGRRTLLALTDSGRALTAAAIGTLEAGLASVLRDIDPKRRKQFRSLLLEVLGHVQDASVRPRQEQNA
jgi:DNA-binding MarR family transcriptional regulator